MNGVSASRDKRGVMVMKGRKYKEENSREDRKKERKIQDGAAKESQSRRSETSA